MRHAGPDEDTDPARTARSSSPTVTVARPAMTTYSSSSVCGPCGSVAPGSRTYRPPDRSGTDRNSWYRRPDDVRLASSSSSSQASITPPLPVRRRRVATARGLAGSGQLGAEFRGRPVAIRHGVERDEERTCPDHHPQGRPCTAERADRPGLHAEQLSATDGDALGPSPPFDDEGRVPSLAEGEADEVGGRLPNVHERAGCPEVAGHPDGDALADGHHLGRGGEPAVGPEPQVARPHPEGDQAREEGRQGRADEERCRVGERVALGQQVDRRDADPDVGQ